jgi:hypothetical protein
MMALVFIGGLLTWTLIEYGMHHWNGHLMKGKTHFSKEHLKHHTTKDHFSTLPEKIRSAAPVSLAILLISGFTIGWALGLVFSLGVVSGYVIYEYLHWAAHMSAPTTAYGRWVRRHHFSHHFMDARFNHGVTTSLWDHVFRTYREPVQIRVPRRFAMEWLLDEDGELKQIHEEDYSLTGRRRTPGRAEAA